MGKQTTSCPNRCATSSVWYTVLALTAEILEKRYLFRSVASYAMLCLSSHSFITAFVELLVGTFSTTALRYLALSKIIKDCSGNCEIRLCSNHFAQLCKDNSRKIDKQMCSNYNVKHNQLTLHKKNTLIQQIHTNYLYLQLHWSVKIQLM